MATTLTGHILSAIEARPASGPGALAHFASTCSCGLVIASTMESSVRLDVIDHRRWAERQQYAGMTPREVRAHQAREARALARVERSYR